MAHAVFTNNARTTLSGSLTNVATSASVVDGSVFPTPTGGDYAYLTIEEGALVEIVKLTARSTNTLTITRAQDGTTAQAFTTAAAVSLRLPRVVLDEFQAAIDAKLNSSAVSAFGGTLIDDADASTARTTLGLGTAAVKNTGTSGDAVPLLNAANTFSADQTIASTSPGLLFNETDAPVNNTNWRIRANASTFTLGTLDKDGLNPEAALSIGRSGVSIGNVQINGATLTFNANTVWHAGNDGAGSGLDADLLDGYNVGTSGATIPLLNAANTFSAAQVVNTTGTAPSFSLQRTDDGATGALFDLNHISASPAANDVPATFRVLGRDSGNNTTVYGRLRWIVSDPTDTSEDSYWTISSLVAGSEASVLDSLDGTLRFNANTVWHAGNDGAGSGLDADLLDGYNVGTSGATIPLLNGTNTFSASQTVSDGSGLARLQPNGDIVAYRAGGTTGVIYLDSSGARYLYYDGTGYVLNGAQLGINGGTAWHSLNDGTGSGLDADLLDGIQGAGYARNGGSTTADLNTIVTSGMWRLEGSNANLPSGTAFGQLIVSRGSDTILQIASDYQGQHLYFRNGNSADVGGSGAYSAWRTIWHSGNFDPATKANLSGATFSGAVTFNGAMTLPGAIKVGGGWQAGSLAYTDANWGMLNRPPVAGALGAHRWDKFDGTEIMRITEAGSLSIGDVNTVTTYGARLGVTSAASTQATIGIWNPGVGFAHIGIAASNSNLKLYNSYSTGTLSGGAGIDINISGNVGIGTDSPTNGILELRKDASSAIGPVLALNNQGGGGLTGSAINFIGAGSQNIAAQIRGSDDGNWAHNLIFSTKQTGASGNALTERMRIASDGVITAATDFRAPIFYDSNDTAFYLDPNSLSVLSTTSTYLAPKDPNANWNTAFQNTPASSYAWHGDSASGTNNPGGAWWFSESMRHGNNTSFWGTQIAWGWEDNANRLLQRNVGAGNYSAWVEYLNTSGRTFSGDLVMGSSLRAPVFYDSANTAFYTDPNGTSVLWKVDVLHGQSVGSLLTASGGLGGLEVKSNSATDAAFINFHRPSAYGAYFGIDTDNQFAVGGWSAGAALAAMKVAQLGVGTAASGTTGEIRATNNITAYYSDMRLKDITGKITNAIEKVTQLNGYYYVENELAEQYGYKNKKEQVGVGAQEVEQVLPHVVTPAPFDIAKNEDGVEYSKSGENYLTVRYERLIPLLIEAIKEQQLQIEQQSARIDQLMAQVNEGE